MAAITRPLWMFVVSLTLSGLLPAQTAWLGIDAESSGSRITITEVFPSSPAKKAGLHVGDVLLFFQGKAVGGDLDGLAAALAKMKPGTKVAFKVLRGKVELPIRVVLGLPPSARKKGRSATGAGQKKGLPPVPKKKAELGKHKVRAHRPGTLGVEIAQQGEKIWVENVNHGSAAQKAGFQVGDQIVAAGGKTIKDVDRLVSVIRSAGAGNKLTFWVLRGSKRLRLEALLDGSSPAKPGGVGKQRRITPSPLPTKWFTNFETARNLSQQTKRPLLVDFYADWCGPCKLLEKSFKAKGVVPQLRRCVLVRVNVDKAARLADRFGVQSIPHVVMLSPEGKTMGSFTGYLPPDELGRRLKRFLGIKANPKKNKRTFKRKGKKASKVKKKARSRPFRKGKAVSKRKLSELDRLRLDYRRLLKRQRILEERLNKVLKLLERIK